jgi:hypothetical protein
MDLASLVRRTPPRLLLPQTATDAYPPDRLELLASLAVPTPGPRIELAVLVDPDEGVHVVPLVVEGEWVRPARAGDGLAVGVVELIDSAASTGPFDIRRHDRGGLDVGDARSEQVVSSSDDTERWLVADRLVVTVHRRPAVYGSPPADLVAHLLAAGFGGLRRDHGDLGLVVSDDLAGDQVDLSAGWVGPLVHVTAADPGALLLRDAFTSALLADIRGGGTPRAVSLAQRLGSLLADYHVAGARPTGSLPDPVTAADPSVVASWRRDTADAVAAASVLAESGPAQRLRAGRDQVRDAVRSFDEALGCAVLPGDALPGLDAFLADPDDTLVLHPDVLVATPQGHAAAQDLAVVLRGVGHLAWMTHRRLVFAGEPIPGEQIADWENGVRETLVDTYLRDLEGSGRRELFVPELLTAFEVQAECQAVVRAARTLSTSMAVSDAALAALLAP